MRSERSDPIVVWQGGELRQSGVSFREVLRILDVAPREQLLQLLEPLRESCPLSSTVGRGRCLEASSQFTLCGVDHGSRKGRLGDESKDLGLERIGRRAA